MHTSLTSASRPVRVLVVSYGFLPDYAGWLQQTLAMIGACDSETVIFHWICAGSPDHADGALPDHLRVSRLGTFAPGHSRINRLLFGLAVFRFLYRHRYDVVYCPSSYWPTELIAFGARLLRTPLVTRVAKSELETHHLGGRLRNRVLPRLAHTTIVLNKETQLALEQSRQRVVYIPNGVDIAKFQPPTTEERAHARATWGIDAQEHILLFVGLLVPYKGVDVALNAFHGVAKDHPNSRLLLAGPLPSEQKANTIYTDYVQNLREFVEQHGLTSRVRFLGHVSQIPSLLRAADVFVFPSYSEGMPNALLEAMATGLPCIASDIAGIRDLIDDGNNGLLFQPGCSPVLADQINLMLNNPDQAQRLGVHARLTIERSFSVAMTARRYQDVLVANADRSVGQDATIS